ncbi:D-alanyl-D-alanine carboxypeptidase family protein [Gordonia sp. (in: high G+C Gram-positive bacteria)]|uniref:D-alanyl-D-alanine carboxypeptidase family protein n=1 Tax=Gordonia sp. (in: high G+C Gram-positive bacteria) TaxID=84139 RepID=UPI0039E71CAD
MRVTALPRVLSTVALAASLAVAPVGLGAAGADPMAPTVAPTSEVTAGVPAEPTPVTDDCPQKTGTPPAVDDSEVVQPWDTTPSPLPVPTPPVGGPRMAECGVVSDAAAGPVPANLTSSAWLIADLDTGEIIAAKDPHGRYRPASTIKVLLALTYLNTHPDLDKVVTANVRDWSMEGDMCGVGPGGRYTIRDILSGLIVVSGNDCANMIARELGGFDQALAKMNATAASIGAKDTRAATPSGLDAPGMSTSPYDEATIFRAAMADEEFRHIITLRNYDFPGYPGDESAGIPARPGYTMVTSNVMLRDGTVPGMIGGKTGYTDDAKKTFVGAIERNGRTLVIVQMYGLSEAGNGYDQQAIRMIDYGFAAPKGTTVGELGEPKRADGATGADRASNTWWIVLLSLLGVGVLGGLAYLLLSRLRGREKGVRGEPAETSAESGETEQDDSEAGDTGSTDTEESEDMPVDGSNADELGDDALAADAEDSVTEGRENAASAADPDTQDTDPTDEIAQADADNVDAGEDGSDD